MYACIMVEVGSTTTIRCERKPPRATGCERERVALVEVNERDLGL